MSARVGVSVENLPTEPNVFVHKANRKLLSPFWSLDGSDGFLSNQIKSALILLSFQWTTWGNNTKDVKTQSIQEVTNFGILSALSLALNISIVATVDGNADWAKGSYFREVIGVIFNVASSALVISLLSSAFLLLIINETPDGRAVVLVIEHIGTWMRLPGFAFMVGVYGFCALITCWLTHTFNLWISLTVCGIFVFIASFSLFGAITTGVRGLHKVMSTFATITIVDETTIRKLLTLYLDAKLKYNSSGVIVGYKRNEFYNWILESYECCDFCDLSQRRLDTYMDKWEISEAHTG